MGFRDRDEGRRDGPRQGGFSSGGDRPPMQKFDAVCASCQKACQVPFKPTEGRPVYCRDCYQQQKPRQW